ncbi:hypothetical protein TGFOU_404750 [Toxoplasma gondii FOU]|uniref:Uncharacterized protein n=1 Tax=Toxoplasma gondii FOU TaxID=943167 RepID=A0A086KWW6_TOXGO|nr:hypothetical protein TGFOU_404750 [Toxoplasma gondii FOU]
MFFLQIQSTQAVDGRTSLFLSLSALHRAPHRSAVFGGRRDSGVFLSRCVLHLKKLFTLFLEFSVCYTHTGSAAAFEISLFFACFRLCWTVVISFCQRKRLSILGVSVDADTPDYISR